MTDLSHISDDELQRIANSSSPDLSRMSDEELMKISGAPAAPSGILNGPRTEQAAQAIVDNMTGEQPSLPLTAIKVMGAGAGAVNDKIMQGASALVPQAVKEGVASGAQGVANAIDSTDAGQYVGDKLLDAKDAASGFAAAHPEVMKVGGALANIAPMESMVNGVRSVAGDMGESAATQLARPAGEFPKAMAAPEFNPIAAHSSISDAYGAAKEAAKPYYNLMQEIASGETANASGLKPALSKMIDDIQNTPFHEAQSELPYLKQQLEKISNNGRIPLNDMVDLKKNLNSNFNPKRFMSGSDTPYTTVSSLVDDSLTNAAERISEFGKAKTLADKNWLNTVKSPFEDNKVLQKFWKPEDYYAKRSVDSGMLEELPDPTMQRAVTLVKNIKNPVQLNAIRRVIPSEMSDSLSAAKIQDITQGEGVTRIGSAGKAIAGAPNLTPSGIAQTGRNLMNIISPRYTPEELALIKAAKVPPPSLSVKYQQPFSELKAGIQQQKDLAGEMQPFQYSKPVPKPKQLTYQPSVMSVPPEGPQGTIPMNPAIRQSLSQSPSTVSERLPGRTIEQDAAWAQRDQEIATAQKAMAEQGFTQAEIEKSAQMKGITHPTLAEDYAARTEPYVETDMAKKLREDGFKKGGHVKKRNLTAEFLGRKYA